VLGEKTPLKGGAGVSRAGKTSIPKDPLRDKPENLLILGASSGLLFEGVASKRPESCEVLEEGLKEDLDSPAVEKSTRNY